MAKKYDVDKLRRILQKYREFDVLSYHGLNLTGEKKDEDIIDALIELEEMNPGTLVNLHTDVEQVKAFIDQDIRRLNETLRDLADRLDKIDRSTGRKSPFLIDKMKKAIEEHERKQDELSHLTTFTWHIQVAKKEVHKKRI